MKIRIVTPAPPGSRHGNRATARRWARLIRRLGHRVTIATAWRSEPCDALVALHAWKSRNSISRFHRAHPGRPLIVALTGTDVYRDLERRPATLPSLERATFIVALQPLARRRLPRSLRSKVRTILQSAEPMRPRPRPSSRTFDVSVAGHLRPVKDPFRAALAARLLPGTSRLRVLHAGRALSPAMARRARAEEARNPRYRWLGELSEARTRRLVASSRLHALTSRLEGGANVVSEALADGVPVVSSRIDGSVGMLGRDYPGYFTPGSTRGLAALLRRAEADPRFLPDLRRRCARLRARFAPAAELEAWRRLLGEAEKHVS